MKISLDIVADYGGKTGLYDMAFAEVQNRLYSLMDEKNIDCRIMSCLSVEAFNTIQTGFVVAQMGCDSNLKNHVIYHNTAPRKDDTYIRKNNAGENLAVALLPNGVLVVGVCSLYTFSFIKNIVPVYKIKCNNYGSQFRSRDVFPQALVDIVQEVFVEKLSDISKSKFVSEIIDDIPTTPIDTLLYVDGYGNLKTSLSLDLLKEQKIIKIVINECVHNAYISNDGIFGIESGNMVIAKGSSGWKMENTVFLEISLRGGSAANTFKNPKPGDKIIIM